VKKMKIDDFSVFGCFFLGLSCLMAGWLAIWRPASQLVASQPAGGQPAS